MEYNWGRLGSNDGFVNRRYEIEWEKVVIQREDIL